MIPISVCIITKNEETKLRKCLECIKDYPFEIVVVDTGSTDKTVEMAREYTSHVYHFDWINDFAAARNFSISKASHNWILVLDSDEYVTSLDLEGLYRLIEAHPNEIGMLIRTSIDTTSSTTVDHVERLFHRRRYAYKRPIHEQVLPINGTPYGNYDLPLYVEHDGYLGTPEEMREKLERNLKILFASEKEYPDSYTYFQIGQAYYALADYENARIYYEKGLNYDLNPQSEYVKLMVVHYGFTLSHLERNEDAITFLEPLYAHFSDFADYIFLLGYLYFLNGNYLKSALQLIKATTLTDFLAEGSNSYLAYYLLGQDYEIIGNQEVAISFYQKALPYEPAKSRLDALAE